MIIQDKQVCGGGTSVVLHSLQAMFTHCPMSIFMFSSHHAL